MTANWGFTMRTAPSPLAWAGCKSNRGRLITNLHLTAAAPSAGQAALKSARVLVVGAGELGAPALLYLAAAGVGTLGIIDGDVVALSNLQRQVIHATPDLGRAKVESAAEAIARLNPHVAVKPHAARLAPENAMVTRSDEKTGA